MPTPRNITINDMSRVWAMEDGAGPAVVPEYMGVWKAGAPSWDFGRAEKVEIPSDVNYQKFQEVASLPGATGKPTMSFQARYSESMSDMLRMARRECYHDIHGQCCRLTMPVPIPKQRIYNDACLEVATKSLPG